MYQQTSRFFKDDGIEMRSRLRQVLLVGALLVLGGIGALSSLGAISAADMLKSPIDVAARRLIAARPTKSFNCPANPPPVQELRGVEFYKDARGSIIDPAAFEQAIQREAPARNYTAALTRLSDSYVRGFPADRAIRDCGLRWLASWAKECALCGTMDRVSETYRVWALTPIATSFLIFIGDEAPNLNDEDLKVIRLWIEILARKIAIWLEESKAQNNLAYWAGAGLALSSVATQRHDFLNLATLIARRAIMEITSNGFLPREAARGRRAFAYHNFALTPLAIIASVAAQNTLDLFEVNDKGLCRLASHLFQSSHNLSDFESVAGAPQDVRTPVSPNQFIWAEIVLNYCNIPDLYEYIVSARPIRFDRAGGDQTLLYGKFLR